MSEQNNYPSFYQHPDEMEPLRPEHIHESRQMFDRLFDDYMIRNMEHVNIIGVNQGRNSARLHCFIEVNDVNYSLELRDAPKRQRSDDERAIIFRNSEKHLRLINIQRLDEQGLCREHWSYRLGADEVVRRWDFGDVWAKEQQRKELGIDEENLIDENEAPEKLLRLIIDSLERYIEKDLPNLRLEEDMGLNNQPVAPEEMAGLTEFINEATILQFEN